MSFLDALDEPLETAAASRIGAFQPKFKPRGKKPNAAGKTKVNVVDQKNGRQQPAKVFLPETKPSVKENPPSLSQDTVGPQLILPIPSVGSPVDVKLDVGVLKIYTVSDPIEEKPVLSTLVSESVDDLLGIHASTSESKLLDETTVAVQEPVVTEITANLISSLSYPVEENPVSLPSVLEPVGAEIMTSFSPPVSQPGEDGPLTVPLVQEIASIKGISPQGPDLEESPVSISSESEPLVQKILCADPIPLQSSAVDEALLSIPFKPEPHTQTISSSRFPVENPVEGARILDYLLQDARDTQAVSLLPSPYKSPHSQKPPAMLTEAAVGVAVQDNDGYLASHDARNDSSPPASYAIAQQSVSFNEEEKPQAELRRSKRKPAAMHHCFTREVGESIEEAGEANVSISSNKWCKVRDQQSQNGASEPGIKHKDSNESITVASVSTEMPGKTTGNGENHSLLNAGDIEKETDCITNREGKKNNNSRCRTEKMLARKPSNEFITVQGIISDNRENVTVPNTNIPPEEGAAPISNSNGKTNDQHRGWRQKLKRNAVNSSAIVQTENLKDRENVLVLNKSSMPENVLATGNDLVDQRNNKLKQQRQKIEGKRAVPDSTKTSQEILETKNYFDSNAEAPLASVVEFITGTDQDDQPNEKSKQKRPKTRSKKPAHGSTKTIQETFSELPVPSNVETGENCFDSNVEVQLNDLPEMNNCQSRRCKQKPTPLTKYLDHNDLTTGRVAIAQPSEDQELNENVTEKQIRKKRKASTSGKSLESSKKKFSHSTVRRRRRVEQNLLDTPEADLDTSKLTLTALIRLAEAKERKQKKEELTNNKLQSTEADSNSNANDPSKEPEEDEGDILAPQVKLVNGQIVINEESLVVSHRDLNTDDFRTYRRVEESTSKLNYHTYMNRTPAERWSKSDTELFYKAMQQFGTDFAMIQHLFPGRTRRQVKAKFKMEEKKNPLQLSDALLHRSLDHSHFDMLIDRLKISTIPAENGNPDRKNSPSTGLEDITLENSDEVHEERGTDTQINSTLDIPEAQETDQYEQRLVIEKDSTFSVGSSQDISKMDERNESSKDMEDTNGGKEASTSPTNPSNEPIAKPRMSLFSYQAGSSKPKSLFGYQL